MLWRFSFASASNVDAILSRETPPSIEELMDEQEILNECKAQNNKLVTYLSKEDSVKSLLQWVVAGLDDLQPDPAPIDAKVIGLGEGLEKEPSKESDRYPQIATEILTSDLWTISETILFHKEALLLPFWDAVLPQVERALDEEADEEIERKQELIRGRWTRVNGALMTKRTHEMVRFIQSIPNIVPRIMAHIDSPAIQDMLIRVVSAEEAGADGVIAWLASEGLVSRLLALLSPEYSTNIHSIASELIKSIITLCAPAPFNPNGGNKPEGAGPGTRDNRMIRELVSESSINTMMSYILDPHDSRQASSLAHICNILVEIIRRNNSDFSEPHLFHTLRHRLMSIQGSDPPGSEDKIAEMEEALKDLCQKMGIVHLGHLIATVSDRFSELHRILKTASTLSRFRVVELYAELLHSSNMSILNRQPGTGPEYTDDGILVGGLAGVEALGEAVEAEPPSRSGSIGDRLKQIYIQYDVLPAVVDLFFEYPNNNFMHHVVYDLLQQILNGRLTPGANSDLIVDLLNKAKLIDRILGAQQANDESVNGGGARLPFMGHIILIAEELLKFFANANTELIDRIEYDNAAWEAFVSGPLKQAKQRDAQPLAGGRPVLLVPKPQDDSSDEEELAKFGEPLTRTVAKEFPPRHVDSSDDDDDDDADWLRPSSDEELNVEGLHVDDGWGDFRSSGDDDMNDPFGDDNFAPSVQPHPTPLAPLTPHDWASEFDREFADDEDEEGVDDGDETTTTSLTKVSTPENPLGPGVSADTHLTPSGLVEKQINGEKVVVPADEVVRGVEGGI